MAQKKWSELSGAQQTAIVVGGAVEIVLTAITWRDLARRDASEVRGPKALWLAASVVQPFGPIAYLAFGRRRG